MTSVQVNILILCLGAIQGVFLFLLLFKKKRLLPGYTFLAAYFIVLLLQIVMKLASKIWLMQNARTLYSLSYELPFLYGPLIYLFVIRVTGQKTSSRQNVFHFIPAIIVLTGLIISLLGLQVPFVFVPFFHTLWAMILQLVSLVAYHVMTFYCLNKYNKRIASPVSASLKYRLTWLRQFVICSAILCCAVAIVICVMYYNFPRGQNMRFGFSALTVFIYWLSYKAWNQPELFAVIRGYSHETVERSIAPKLTVHLPLKKYSNSGLSENDIERIIAGLGKKMKMDKPYLDAELTIDSLAESIECTRHHLSQVINEQLGKSFYDYINQYRVEEAKQLLADPSRGNHKIASIAYDAGFNSISTFNDVFKKLAGSTPSQFRKQREEKLQQQRV